MSILQAEGDRIENFLNATTWTMAEPKPYGLFHIVILLVGIPVSIALAWKLRRMSDRSHHRILFTIVVVLLLSELYKQLFHFYIMDNETYDWQIFLFQLCSLPTYLCTILPFIKRSGWLIPLETFLMDFNLPGGLTALLVPDGLMHPYITLTLHAFVQHFPLLFIGFFTDFSRHGDTSLSEFIKTLPILPICIGAATLLDVLFHSYGDINIFYISPYKITTQPVSSQTMKHTGIWIGNLFCITAMCITAFLIHRMFTTVRRGYEK